jgi:small neutral amino acid transporter SnatA (MarC family)
MFLLATAAVGVSVPGGPALADPCTIDALVASASVKVVAGLALALSGLTVTASMFIVRKWLWRYLGVHASDLLRRFGSLGLLLAVLGIAGGCPDRRHHLDHATGS